MEEFLNQLPNGLKKIMSKRKFSSFSEARKAFLDVGDFHSLPITRYDPDGRARGYISVADALKEQRILGLMTTESVPPVQVAAGRMTSTKSILSRLFGRS